MYCKECVSVRNVPECQNKECILKDSRLYPTLPFAKRMERLYDIKVTCCDGETYLYKDFIQNHFEKGCKHFEPKSGDESSVELESSIIRPDI